MDEYLVKLLFIDGGLQQQMVIQDTWQNSQAFVLFPAYFHYYCSHNIMYSTL